MVRLSLLVLAAILCAAASLTAVKAPTLFTWKVALLVGEFGHFVCVAPLTIIAITLMRRGTDPAGGVGGSGWQQILTLSLCVIAVGLLLKPTAQAMTVARALPAQLERAFGEVDLGRAPFALGALAGEKRATVAPETRVFSGADTAAPLALDFYRAVNRSAAPCVVMIHAGGWDNGERTQLAPINHRLAHRGYAVATIDYRLAPGFRWPAQRDDVRAAIAFLRAHAAELGIDPGRIVLMGRSAGGQLAEAVAYGRPDPGIRGVIALYAPADLHFAWKHTREKDVLNSFRLMKQYLGGPPETAKAGFDEASPYLHVNRQTPPTLLMHGKLDTLVWHRQSERLAARLAEAGVPHVFLDLPWATHAFDVNLDGPGGQLGAFAIDWFLAAATK